MTALTPLLRTRTALGSTPLFTLRPTVSTQTRHANLIPRPKRPYLLDQIVILSDGSSYKQLTTSPRGVIRSAKDVKNNPLWNPSMRELADVEEDEAGRLRRFRERFGMGFESEGADGADEMESLLVSEVVETKKKK
ncbi:hypothetical protein BDD12DRAFT_818915 [Trichophaea hybrida]|nr:hypothetical protein BDD12DRAFT_818915 [Trichophaea hybrida]